MSTWFMWQTTGAALLLPTVSVLIKKLPSLLAWLLNSKARSLPSLPLPSASTYFHENAELHGALRRVLQSFPFLPSFLF